MGIEERPTLDRFVSYWRQRQVEQDTSNRQLACQAKADALCIAAMLRKRFGVQRVILFGSLARQRFAPGSDIDLAVAGLARADFFAALAEANRLSRFWVDLKPLEDLEPRFRERVLNAGEEIG